MVGSQQNVKYNGLTNRKLMSVFWVSTDWRKKEILKWPHRMGITMGIARGIQFLHTGTQHGIFGNDLTIENVLLDDNLTAKISSYNISLSSKVEYNNFMKLYHKSSNKI